MAVEVWAPSDLLGDVLGDLSPRRGQILSTEQDGRLTKVNALVRARRALPLFHGTPFHHPRQGNPSGALPWLCRAPPEVAKKVASEHKRETPARRNNAWTERPLIIGP